MAEATAGAPRRRRRALLAVVLAAVAVFVFAIGGGSDSGGGDSDREGPQATAVRPTPGRLPANWPDDVPKPSLAVWSAAAQPEAISVTFASKSEGMDEAEALSADLAAAGF